MANSLPFNAVAVDGEYDRVYKAEDWAWYFATFIANGIFPKPSDGLQVVAYSGMEIRVNAGYAFINGYAFRNPATLSVTLDTAEGALNRVDRVVVRWDLPQRDIPEQVRTYLGLDTVGVAEFFALLYIAYEVVSIFKNMALCGLPVKKVWEKVREFLAKYTDELPDTDELDGDSTTGNVEEHRTQER